MKMKMKMMPTDRSIMQQCNTKSPIRHIVVDAVNGSETNRSDTLSSTNNKGNIGTHTDNVKSKLARSASNTKDDNYVAV